MKVYLAGPFFSSEQAALVEELEEVIIESGWEMFSPRKGKNAIEMNEMISSSTVPSNELRSRVFRDNWYNIDDASIVIAVIDNFDVGTMWECGYAFKAAVPVITHTDKDYGCNLMLAHSIVGHTKSIDDVRDVLGMITSDYVKGFWVGINKVSEKYKSDFALKEGPDEREQ